MRSIELFTGCGGGTLGTMLCGYLPIGYVEWDAYCQQVIAARIRDGIFPVAPIFTDVRQFILSGAAAQYRGFVDLVAAGFPCQPFSVAGKQLADADFRNMWPPTAEVIRIIQPTDLILENVPGLISCGYIGLVYRDLAKMGYVYRAGVLGANAMGAYHRRERVWIVAHAIGHKRKQPCLRTSGRMGREQQPVPWDRPWESALRELRGMDDGIAYRTNRTDATRNGQVSAVVRAAWGALA